MQNKLTKKSSQVDDFFVPHIEKKSLI